MSKDPDFVQLVSARWTSLYRLAYLLTASPTAAEEDAGQRAHVDPS